MALLLLFHLKQHIHILPNGIPSEFAWIWISYVWLCFFFLFFWLACASLIDSVEYLHIIFNDFFTINKKHVISVWSHTKTKRKLLKHLFHFFFAWIVESTANDEYLLCFYRISIILISDMMYSVDKHVLLFFFFQKSTKKNKKQKSMNSTLIQTIFYIYFYTLCNHISFVCIICRLFRGRLIKIFDLSYKIHLMKCFMNTK